MATSLMDMATPRLPELLLPAGGFDAALAAFKGGADAVYLGFKAFSARRQASNFDWLEYRRLHALAARNRKKLYVTLNTALTERDLPGILDLLGFLEAFPPSAIIFQDWGLASMIRADFPSLALHASTQTAIQTPEAAKRAYALGVERIVLPRECGQEDLRRFKAEAPMVEYEVFVHGALCYSFSGLCLASGLLVGRSANRGECAQLCRSYYSKGQGAEAAKGYFFSGNDLDLSESLEALVAAGADSLKVEGRMKSPEYVYSVARLYRAALERLAGRGPSDQEFQELKASAQSAFARRPSLGYLENPKGTGIIDSTFPGHRGIHLGRVVASTETRAQIQLDETLGQRDGVLYLQGEAEAKASGGLAESIPFPALDLANPESGKPLFVARPGSLVELTVPQALPVGAEVRRISSRTDDLKKNSPEEYPPSIQTLAASLGVAECEGGGRLSLEIDPKAGRGLGGSQLEDGTLLVLQAGRNPGGFSRVLDLFKESGDYDFRIEAAFAPQTLEVDGASLELKDLFVPPSLLKKAKNSLYERLATMIEASQEVRGQELLDRHCAPISLRGTADAPRRSALVFSHPGLPSGMPYCTPRILAQGMELPEWQGKRFLPLAPVVADWPSYRQAVSTRVRTEIALGRDVCVGLDAFHHLDLAHELWALPGASQKLSFFGDIHLNISAPPSAQFWASIQEGVAFLYASLEFPPLDTGSANLVAPDPAFRPPLFVSKACYLRHNAGSGECPPGCKRNWEEEIHDRERKYLILGEDCISYLFDTATKIVAKDNQGT